jgi:Phage integrase, N-terminal SAM-like domain
LKTSAESNLVPRICRDGWIRMGTMRERTPGTWELVVSAGLDPATGRYRRVTRTVKTTSKREAKAALAELEVGVASGRVAAVETTMAELLARWMAHITSLGRAETTLYHYRQYIDREIAPVLGSIRLSKLTALDIDRLYSKLRKRGLAPATIRQMPSCEPPSTRPSGGDSFSATWPSPLRRHRSRNESNTHPSSPRCLSSWPLLLE